MGAHNVFGWVRDAVHLGRSLVIETGDTMAITGNIAVTGDSHILGLAEAQTMVTSLYVAAGTSIVAGTSIAAATSIKSSGPTSGIGYGTGAGGTVSQGTSKATGVTLSTMCGAITTFNDALAAGAEVSFIVTNTAIAATDVVIACIKSGPATAGSYSVSVSTIAAGSYTLTLTNLTAGALSEAVVINVAVIKAVAA